ncbi:hypothetical protein VP01_254g1, partial [Puccinia sorghi]
HQQEHDKLSTTGSKSARDAPADEINSPHDSCSSDVELIGHGRPPTLVNRSPVRKLPRSPAGGHGVAHTLNQQSPPRKVPTSIGSSYAASSNPGRSINLNNMGSPIGTPDLRPLTAAGRKFLSELQELHFPLPIARQLKTGAMRLALTHVATDIRISTAEEERSH